MRRLTGDYLGAVRDLEQALATYRDLGSRLGQANALTFLGVVRRLTGDYPAAARDLEQALATYRDLGDRDGERALELARVIASAWHEAQALACMGRCAIARGRIAQAKALLRQAHEIFQQIGAADAPAVLAELNALPIRGSRVQLQRRPSRMRKAHVRRTAHGRMSLRIMHAKNVNNGSQEDDVGDSFAPVGAYLGRRRSPARCGPRKSF